MSFRGVFLAVVLATAMVLSALVINARRPRVEVVHPTAALVRATGKCADCHRHETAAVVHEYEMSKHSAAGVTCLHCHQPAEGQKSQDHKGFAMTSQVTAANCKQCHAEQYDQYLRSRHAAPAWAAVSGTKDFTVDQISFSEQFHEGGVDRPANPLVKIEGTAVVNKGCYKCHDVGKPNEDGSIGSCTACHARHVASVELARTPETCGQCHMGPDHAQLEIYHESKHGVIFNAQKHSMNLAADPKNLKVEDMPVPTCATCHMSSFAGNGPTHDTSERLSYYLFAAVSDRRPDHRKKAINMKTICLNCHTNPNILKFYSEAESVVRATNKQVEAAKKIVDDLRAENLLTPEPFDEPIEFLYFDLWHYGGRTAKHGAFMGGADFVQWHGSYELVQKINEIEEIAKQLRLDQKTKELAAAAVNGSAPAVDEVKESVKDSAPVDQGNPPAFVPDGEASR